MGVNKRLFSAKVKVSGHLKRRIEHVIGGKKNVMMKRAMRKAIDPAAKSLKSEVRILRTVSDQSSGATLRSMTKKAVFPSVGNKNYGYAYAGVNMNHKETVGRDKDFSGAGKVRAHIRNAKIAGVSETTNKRTGRVTVRAVKGYQKHVRRSKKAGHPAGKQVSRPGKYWHLINEGFTHKSGTTFTGYKFEQRASNANKQKMVNTMKSEISKFIKG
jgi:hypothetical protein